MAWLGAMVSVSLLESRGEDGVFGRDFTTDMQHGLHVSGDREFNIRTDGHEFSILALPFQLVNIARAIIETVPPSPVWAELDPEMTPFPTFDPAVADALRAWEARLEAYDAVETARLNATV